MQLAGFPQSLHDHSLFFKRHKESITLLVLHVDDIVITGNDSLEITALKDHLHAHLDIKDLCSLKFFLGIEVALSKAGICLNRRKYVLKLLSDAGMTGCKPFDTPMEQHLKLTSFEFDKHTTTTCSDPPLSDPSSFQRLVGCLMYLIITRPDICYAVQRLSEFMKSPKQSHMNAAIRVLGYLKSAPALGILLSAASDLTITAYCDSVWDSCPLSRWSFTGYITKLGLFAISWKTKKHNIVSRSSAEAEYRSMATTICEIIWLRILLIDMGLNIDQPTVLYCDNQAAIHIFANPLCHELTKHIKIDCHFVREKLCSNIICLAHIHTRHQPADVFTKALGSDQHHYLLCKLDMLNILQA